MALVAHRDYWMCNNATDVSPTYIKMLGDSNAVRSRVTISLRTEFGCHWIQQGANNWKIQPAAGQSSASHPMYRTGFSAARLQME